MPKFRKKPVVIEAIHWVHAPLWEQWPEWLRAAWYTPMEEPGAFFQVGTAWTISTLEGLHIVSDGDWIIQGVAGELYPCKPDIFAATYEPAEEE